MLLKQLGSEVDVRLWALDEVAPDLADRTIGCGPGGRFVHLNRLYGARPVADGSWLVVADDDVLFVRGDLDRTIQLMKQAGFSLAQPGQSILGWWTTLFVLGRPFVVASDTDIVEIGPLFVADPTFAKEILPFPDQNGMGWGMEAEWYRIKEGRYRIGIIDSCRVVHLIRSARQYAVGPEMKQMHERLASCHVDSMWDLRTRNRRWWTWQNEPPWKGEDRSSGESAMAAGI
jgi:hypothetical protein